MSKASTSVSIRIDCDVKAQADELFDKLGMSMATAFNIFIRQAIRNEGIPFEVSLNSAGRKATSANSDAELKDSSQGDS